MPIPVNYHGPVPGLVNPPQHGRAALFCGVGAALAMYGFQAADGLSVLNPTVLLAFPLVSAIPILGLTSIVRGVDAVAVRRQVGWAVVGMALGLWSMAHLGRVLFLR